MRVLITGSSGQIGTNLGHALLGLGHSVTGLDNRPNPWTSAIPTQIVDLSQALPAQRGALGDVEVGPVDAVVHLAAHAKVHALVERPLGALENHHMVTNALEFARVNGVPIILASSREVYGNLSAGPPGTPGEPVPESAADFRLAPSPYAAMKLAGESLAAAYRRCYGLSFAVIRFSNVYGRHDNDLQRLERAIWVFRQRILAGRPVTIFGATKTLDFTYVDDAVAGLMSCVQRLVAGDATVVGETFNLAYGEGHRLVDVVTLIADALGERAQIQLQDARPGEVTWYVADLTKARRALEYRPRVPVQEGIRRAMRWAQEVEQETVAAEQRPARW